MELQEFSKKKKINQANLPVTVKHHHYYKKIIHQETSETQKKKTRVYSRNVHFYKKMIYYITNHQQTTRMIIQTILPTKRSSILLPTSLVQSEMTKRTGIKFSGTIYHCPENPDGYNSIDPKIDGAVVGLIQQILCFTPDYVLLFEIPEFISKEDYKEMADIPGIDRVFIVNVGESQSPIDK